MKLAVELRKILNEEGLGPIKPDLLFKIYDILKKDYPQIEKDHSQLTFYHYITNKLKGV